MKKKVKVAHMHGTLLIASPEWSNGKFLTLATGVRFINEFNGFTTVDVVALECKTKEEIPDFLDNLAKEFEKFKKTPNVENCIRWFKQTREELSDEINIKKIPEYLMKNIRQNLTPCPTQGQMTFLCGVTYLE